MLRSMWKRFMEPAVPKRRLEDCLRGKGLDCRECVDICPSGLLEALPGRVSLLAAEACSGCLLCASVCRAGCHLYPEKIIKSWALGLGLSRGPLTISCGEVFAPGEAWAPCAGSLSYTLLAYLAALGNGLILRTEDCGDCSLSQGREALNSRLVSLCHLQNLLGSSREVTVTPRTARRFHASSSISRRGLLGQELERAAGLVRGGLLEAGVSLGAVGSSVDSRAIARAVRLWFLEEMAQAQEPVPTELLPFPLLRSGGVTEAGALRGVRDCPSGSLRLQEEDTGKSILHHRGTCLGCQGGRCPLWPDEAAQWSPGDPSEPVATVVSWPRVTCSRCGHIYVDSYGVCPRCLVDGLGVQAASAPLADRRESEGM